MGNSGHQFGQVLGLFDGSSIGLKREISVYHAWVSFFVQFSTVHVRQLAAICTNNEVEEYMIAHNFSMLTSLWTANLVAKN